MEQENNISGRVYHSIAPAELSEYITHSLTPMPVNSPLDANPHTNDPHYQDTYTATLTTHSCMYKKIKKIDIKN